MPRDVKLDEANRLEWARLNAEEYERINYTQKQDEAPNRGLVWFTGTLTQSEQ
jgi:hypothetical protein